MVQTSPSIDRALAVHGARASLRSSLRAISAATPETRARRASTEREPRP